ncbi:murein transglycosylase, partial [Mesorhizobium sp. M4B.F.Ca.ET.190.01.1.1]
MAFLAKGRMFAAATVMAVLALATGAQAAGSCGKNGAGFDAWKQDFAAQAKSEGVGARGLSALAGATYATR